MKFCPQCRSDLTESDLESGQCANCQAVLSPVPTVNDVSPTVIDVTAQDYEPMTGAEADESEDHTSTRTANETKIDATVELDEGLNAELAQSDSDPAEIDATQVFGQTVEIDSSDGGEPNTNGDTDVGDSSRLGETILSGGLDAESGSLESAALDSAQSEPADSKPAPGQPDGPESDSESTSAAGTKTFLTENGEGSRTRFNETVQLDSEGLPIEPTLDLDSIDDGNDSALGATLDSDAAAILHPTWMGAIETDSHPTMSLKSDVQDSGSASSSGSSNEEYTTSLNIQTRVLVSDAKADQSDLPADYGVLEILGKGGMGIVYSAHQASLDRNVAVKMLLPEGAKNRKSRNAFLSEAAVTGDLEHPNIVPVYDLGRAPDGAFFYAMKQVRGTPWDKTIRSTPLPENLEYLLRVCDAAAFAHSKGIIHRDLKPENTMIGDFGEVMVMDWGLAIPADGRRIAGIELGQTMAGTPSYMAPEMAAGPFGNITKRSDIYLLGAILFEVVTGRPPHTGASSRACMINAARNTIRDTNVKSELVDIALKAMATKQKNRYQSVQEFQQAIRDYQSHSESIALSTLATESLTTARESGSYSDFNRSVFGFQQAIDLWSDNAPAREGLLESKYDYAKLACERGDYDLGAGLLDSSLPDHRVLQDEIVALSEDRERRQQRSRLYRQIGVGLAGALFLVVSGAAIWINTARQDAVNQRELADLAKTEADIKRAQAIEAQESEQQQRVIAEQKQKDAEQAREKEREQRELAEAAQEAERQQRVAAENARMEAERAKLAEQQQRKVAEDQRKFAEQQRQEAVDARQAEAYEAYVARIAAAASRIEENAYLGALELLRDCIPVEGETDFRNWEWGRMVYLCKQASQVLPTGHPLETVAASRSGGDFGLVATAGDSGVITVWAPSTGLKRTFEVPADTINSIAFSPDNRQLAVGTDTADKFIQIVDLATGRVDDLAPTSSGDAHQQSVLSVEYSSDGKRLLSTSRSGKIKVWDLVSRRALVTLHRHRSAVQQAKFFPSPPGQPQTKIVSVSHDGTAVVWVDNSGRWSSLDSIEEKGIFREHRGPVFAVAISDDGKKIATAGHGARILIWSDSDLKNADLVKAITENVDVSNLTEYRHLSGHTAAVRSLDFAQSSDLLLSSGHDNTVRVWNAESGDLIKVLRGHGRWVRGCVVSNDGRSVVSAGYDGTARFWDIEGYEQLRVLRGKVLTGHEDGIMAAAFSGNSQRVVTASRDRTVKSWESATGAELRQFREGHTYLASNAVAYQNGRFLATAAGDETVRLWDVETGAEIRRLKGTGQGAAIDVSRDGRFVLTGGPANVTKRNADTAEAVNAQTKPRAAWSARLWDAQTGRELHQLFGHRAMVSTVAISPDSKLLYTGDVNGTGVLWDRATGRQIRKLPLHQSKVIRARFTADGRRLITASFERGIATWNVATGKVDTDKILLHPRELVSVDIDPSGQTVVTSSVDQQVRVWDTRSQQVVQTFEVTFDGKPARIDKVAISPDRRTVVAVNRQQGVARAFDIETGREITFLQGSRRGGLIELVDGSQLNAVVFANDSSHVVSIGGDQIRLWGMNPRQPQFRRLRMNFSPHGGVASASFSSDSREIVSGSWDGTANVWDAETGVVRMKLVGRHAGPVHCATFSPDGRSRLIATASADRTIVLWNADTGEFVKRLMGHQEDVNWVAFSPDGKRLVSASNDEMVRVWEIANPDNLIVYQHESAVLRVSFSPDGKRIASSTMGNLALIWDARVGADPSTPLFELAGHTAPVTSVAFSPDGKRAITGSEDFTAKVWDVTQRGPKELIALRGHARTVTSVAFSPDRLHVLTGSQDGTAIIWMAGPWDEMNRESLKVTEHDALPIEIARK